MEDTERAANPVIVDRAKGGAKPRVLHRVALNQRTIAEKDLQDLIFANPRVIPVNAIEEQFGPLIPLGREVPTSAGPIDVLFISPRGFLTIVETKLWRNPQARREVLSQVIHYATSVQRLSVEQFTEMARKTAPVPGGASGLYEYVAGRSDPAELPTEQAFYDQLSRGLRNARFLLVIAGDGIDEDVEGLARFLPQVPQLQFTVALVELVLYMLDDGQSERLLVVPRVTARTREIERVVVRFVAAEAEAQIDVRGPESAATGVARKTTLTEQDFLDQLVAEAGPDARAPAEQLMAFLEQVDVEVRFRRQAFAARLLDPKGSAQKLSLFYVDVSGVIGFGWMREQQLGDIGLPPSFADFYYDAIVNAYGLRRNRTNYPVGLTLKSYARNPEPLHTAVRSLVDTLRRVE
jgi:hypothetical protein